ncbi:MAG: DUF512 domain-containing protein [Acidimicrobiales bacterium]
MPVGTKSQAPVATVVAVVPGSAAERAGLAAGDQVRSINGIRPRDVIEWSRITDDPEIEIEVDRGGLSLDISVYKDAGQVLGAEVDSALFDQVRTCDNHCSFCFIYQLPPGLRSSLYVKDDDYRLSFLYGNYTTLTRFTEMDLERVVTDRLGPLNVSIHATDPDLRSAMLRNRRGAMSLRWLRVLLDHGIEVHGQVVVCPGVNDGPALDDTLCGVLDEFAELRTVCVVPLGISRYSSDPSLRPHTPIEATAVVDLVEGWQQTFLEVLGRRVVFAADEYYLMANRAFPDAASYEGFPQHEDGVGMVAALRAELLGSTETPMGVAPGFFAWVDGAGREGYREQRTSSGLPANDSDPRAADRGSATRPAAGGEPPVILTGEYGARVLKPLLLEAGYPDVIVTGVPNRFFGGNIAVAGLMAGRDVAETIGTLGPGRRYLLPDVCLSGGRFIDGTGIEDLPSKVEVVPTDGVALRRALGPPG